MIISFLGPTPIKCAPRKNLTDKSDAENIWFFMQYLELFFKRVKMGYEGDFSKDGEMHGKGKYAFADGCVYEVD